MKIKDTTFSIALFVLITQCLPGFGQNNYQLNKNWWITDDVVKTVLEYNGKVYLGGHFNYIGPDAPYGGCVDVITEEADTNYLTPNGAVNAVIADGSGGWYIGGEFTFIGNTPRKHIARLNSDGTLDSWNPGADNDVHALMISGNLIYAGGTFTNIGGAARNRIAALDTTTGLASAWNPDANDKVTCFTKNNNVVYV